MNRKSGVLLHISSLHGGYSIGSLGKEAREFCDFLSECAFSIWQVLPLSIPDRYNSPYSSHSSFIENPYFIDLETLYEKGLITRDELNLSRERTPYLCEFERLKGERIALLKRASQRAYTDEALRTLIEARAERKSEVRNAAKFLAKREKSIGIPWQKWNDAEYNRDDYFFYLFLSYEFCREWEGLRQYAHSRGIDIIGDLPIYPSLDSSDLYYNRDAFILDEEGYPTHVAGVPPDYFSADGQTWNNPIYNYEAPGGGAYTFISSRLRHALEYLDGVRLDHFRGYESYYAIPYGESSARHGEWKAGGGKRLIDEIKKTASERLIIAEDLGNITDEVRELLSYSGFPGMRVLQFGFMGDDSCHLPHNYVRNSVAYTGTHDNNTLLGFVYEMSESDRRRAFDYAGYFGDDLKRGTEALFNSVLGSSSDIAIFPIQDLLGYGCDTRMNTPGVADGNWAYRVTREQLESIDRGKFLYFNRLYGR